MAWRCEVRTLRGEWLVLDEEKGTVGQRLPSRRQYERGVLRMYPILRRREYRITQFDAPKSRTLFTMTIPLPNTPAARRLIH